MKFPALLLFGAKYYALMIFALILIFQLRIAPFPGLPILFEDGSFIIFWITGCVPLELCQ